MTAKSTWLSTYVLLLQLREFIPVGEALTFIYLIKGPEVYELPEVAECFTSNVTCTDIEM